MNFKKILIFAIVALVLLFAVSGIYFIGSSVMEGVELPLDIKALTTDMNIGVLEIENGVPSISLTVWAIVIMACILVFAVLSMAHNIAAIILSVISIVFPFLFGSGILDTYSQALEMGVAAADAAGVLVISVLLVGLATLTSPAILIARSFTELSGHFRHFDKLEDLAYDNMKTADARVNAIKKFMKALSSGRSLEDLHNDEYYRYYSVNIYTSPIYCEYYFAQRAPKAMKQIDEDYSLALRVLSACEAWWNTILGNDDKAKKQILSEIKGRLVKCRVKALAITVGVSALISVLATGLLVLFGYLTMLWSLPVATITAILLIYMLWINVTGIVLHFFPKLLSY